MAGGGGGGGGGGSLGVGGTGRWLVWIKISSSLSDNSVSPPKTSMLNQNCPDKYFQIKLYIQLHAMLRYSIQLL